MDIYKDIFKLFYKDTSPKLETNEKYCFKCGRDKYMDTINSYFVCIECGCVSNIKCVQTISFFDKSSYVYISTYNYSRFNQFEKHLIKINYIPNHLKTKMKIMFKRISPIFDKICTHRTNFIRYKYVIIKILELINESQLCKYVSLPKSNLITYKYDIIWKQICDKLGWKYINTVCLLCIIEEKKRSTKNNNKYITIY